MSRHHVIASTFSTPLLKIVLNLYSEILSIATVILCMLVYLCEI